MLGKVALLSALGGFLFGYDLGLIGGAMLGISDTFHISSGTKEAIVGSAKLGAFFGTFIGGVLMLRYGRRLAIGLQSVFFVAGPVLMAVANGPGALIAGRLLVGLGIGATAIAVPAYLAEIAPAKNRGAVVQVYEVMLTLGMLMALIIDWGLSSTAGSDAWRWMVGLPAVPGACLLATLIFLPESPRWLVMRGDLDSALQTLHKIVASSSSSTGGGSTGGGAVSGSSSGATGSISVVRGSHARRRLEAGLVEVVHSELSHLQSGPEGSEVQQLKEQQALEQAEDELLHLWSSVQKEQAAGLELRQAATAPGGRQAGRPSTLVQGSAQAAAAAAGGSSNSNAHSGFGSSTNARPAAVSVTGATAASAAASEASRAAGQLPAAPTVLAGAFTLDDEEADCQQRPQHHHHHRHQQQGLLPGASVAAAAAAKASNNKQPQAAMWMAGGAGGADDECQHEQLLGPSFVNSSCAAPHTAAAAGSQPCQQQQQQQQQQQSYHHPPHQNQQQQHQRPVEPGQESNVFASLWAMLCDIRAVARGPERVAFAIACCLAVFDQATASTAIINYAPEVLSGRLGVHSQALAILYPAVIALTKVVGVGLALMFVDSYGRKPLLVWGGVGCGASLLMAGIGLAVSSVGLFLAGLCLFIFSFSTSWAGLYWVVVSEIFSMGAKSPATSAATSLLFLTGAVVNFLYLSLVEWLGAGAFALFAGMAFGSAWYVSARVPETSGKTLAEIQVLLATDGSRTGGPDARGDVSNALVGLAYSQDAEHRSPASRPGSPLVPNSSSRASAYRATVSSVGPAVLDGSDGGRVGVAGPTSCLVELQQLISQQAGVNVTGGGSPSRQPGSPSRRPGSRQPQ